MEPEGSLMPIEGLSPSVTKRMWQIQIQVWNGLDQQVWRVLPIAACDQCLNKPIILLESAPFEELRKKEGIARELNALGKAAFQVVGRKGVFLCKEGEAVFEYGWHGEDLFLHGTLWCSRSPCTRDLRLPFE